MTRTTRIHAHGLCCHVLITAIMVLAIACVAGTAFAQGQGKGGGGGGGGGGGETPPPTAADPAIAFLRGSSGLAVMDADGSNLTTIVNGVLNWFAWSPDLDGDSSNGYQGALAFQSMGTSGLDVWVCDVRSVNGSPTALRLRHVASGTFAGISWSPDLDPDAPGYQGALLYSKIGDTGVANMLATLGVVWDGNASDPSTLHDMTDEVIFVAQTIGTLTGPQWSSDGLRITFSGQRLDGGFRDLYVIDDVDDPSPRLIVQQEDVGGSPVEAQWSRTGNTIAFQAAGWFWLVDADDPAGILAQIVVGESPTWAPDDGAIAFSAVASPGKTHKIRLYDFATGNTVTLAGDKNINYRYPKWRPF